MKQLISSLKSRTIKPPLFFLLAALFFGTTFLILTPPFQAPDEINHFYKAYQIADGHLLSEKTTDRLGGYVPESFPRIVFPFLGLRWDMHAKTTRQIIVNQSDIPLNECKKVFVDFPNTALYSPVSYAPQAASVWLLKQFGLPPLWIFYGTRLFSLLFWGICVWHAIRILPVYQWLFTLLALLPMSLFTNMSLSADIMTNASAFLLIAYLLRFSFQEKSFTWQNFGTLAFLAVVLASSKIVYTPLILLFALIPAEKFKNRKTFYGLFTLLSVLAFGTALFWSHLVNQLYIPYDAYNPAFRNDVDLVRCGSINGQLDYILSHRWYIFKVFAKTIPHTFYMYFPGYIGTFGWLDTKLPAWLVLVSYLAIFSVALFERNANASFTKIQRTLIFSGAIGTTALLFLSQHLTWDCIGSDVIPTIQGRYFIPIFPLLFLLLLNRRLQFKYVPLLVGVISIFILSFSALSLYARYFVEPSFTIHNIRCDAENLTSDQLFRTSDPNILLENGGAQSNQKSRSGAHSVRLYPQWPYGMTYRFFEGKRGDIIQVEAWRHGNSGEIVLTGNAGNEFYLSSSKTENEDAGGWKKVQVRYTLQNDMNGKEIGIYLFNNQPDTCYFDDLSISILKISSYF